MLSALGGVGRRRCWRWPSARLRRGQGWPLALPGGLAGGVGAAVFIGALAGLYPAARAARLSPTEALATS